MLDPWVIHVVHVHLQLTSGAALLTSPQACKCVCRCVGEGEGEGLQHISVVCD